MVIGNYILIIEFLNLANLFLLVLTLLNIFAGHFFNTYIPYIFSLLLIYTQYLINDSIQYIKREKLYFIDNQN